MRTKTSRKAVQEAADPDHCTHPEVDHRGSARGIRRTVCKVCFKLLDEGPPQPSNLEGELKKAPLHHLVSEKGLKFFRGPKLRPLGP